MTAHENQISGQKNRVEECSSQETRWQIPWEKKASCMELIRSSRWNKQEKRNMWRGNNYVNSGRKLLELKKVMRPWISRVKENPGSLLVLWGQECSGTLLWEAGSKDMAWDTRALMLGLPDIEFGSHTRQPNVCLTLHRETLSTEIVQGLLAPGKLPLSSCVTGVWVPILGTLQSLFLSM